MPSREARAAYAILLFSVMALLSLRFWFMAANSATADEFIHIESGYRYWQCGDYGVSPENPPLSKLVAAFPIRNWQLSGFLSPCGAAVTPSRGPDVFIAKRLLLSANAPLILWEARAAMIVFPLALLLLVFFASRSFFGYGAAAIAAVLVAFEPTLIAHGSLAEIDMAYATCTFAAAWAAYEYAIRPSIWRLLLLGLAIGFALTAKFLSVSVPLVALTIVLLPAVAPNPQWKALLRRSLGWLGACAVAWVILWAIYGFRYSALPESTASNYDFDQLLAFGSLRNSVLSGSIKTVVDHRLLPEAYVAGLAIVSKFDSSLSYLLGKTFQEGVWYYYLVALPIKLTIPVLALALVSIVTPQLWRKNRMALMTLLVAAAFSFGIVMLARVNVGVRHVLPTFPVLCVLASAGAWFLLNRSKWTRYLATVLIAFHLFSSLRAAPGQLSYANEIAGGPSNLYKVVADSNLDWGQSDAAIDKYVHSHVSGPCAIGWSGPHRSSPPCIVLPTAMDVLNTTPPPVLSDHFTGTILLQPAAVLWTDAYVYFLRRKPDNNFAHGSVLVYNGTFDMHALTAASHVYRGIWMLLLAHNPESAVSEFAAADKDCPTSDRPMQEQMYATALVQLHRSNEAKAHFERLLELSKGHPGLRAEHAMAVEALKKL